MLKRHRTLSQSFTRPADPTDKTKKKDGWIYSTKDKAFYEIVPGGRGGAMLPMEIPSPDEWVVNKDSVEVTATIQGTSDPYRRFILKRNNKNYKGWKPTNTPFMWTALNS